RCGRCPLARQCAANREGLQDLIPAKSPRPETVAVDEVAVVVRRERRVLLVQRPPHGRWAGMWEFPHRELAAGQTHEQAARELLAAQVGVEADLGPELLTVRHAVTRFRIRLVCLEAAYRSGEFRPGHYPRAAWAEPGELAHYPVSSPQRKLARALAEPQRQRRLF
ncbi:MAG TPA: NUDIX domain-containing protein, partial [Gemmataceae bacterium]